MPRKFYSLRAAANILDVSIDTLRKWIRADKMKAYQFQKGGDLKISQETLEKVIEHGMDRVRKKIK